MTRPHSPLFFFFNDTATTEIYTLSLHDALPILVGRRKLGFRTKLASEQPTGQGHTRNNPNLTLARSEEHTSELQSRQYLVCRLLLEKKKNNPAQPSDS